MWGNKLIGGIGDQVGHIVWAQLSHNLFSISDVVVGNSDIYRIYFDTQLQPWFSSQPIMFTLLSLLLSLFGPNFYNVLLLITLGLNFYFSYRLFRRFRYTWFYVLVFNFSSYFWIHFGEHIELSQVWMYCILFELLLDSIWIKSPFKFSLWLVFFSLISNYIGFFSLVYFGVYAVIYSFINRVTIPVSVFFTTVFKVGLFYVLILCFSIFPYIQANYINPTNLNTTGSKSMQRDLGEYIIFSSRPWYFLIPSTKNHLFGDLSENLYEKISSTGNYLADDYFVYEHSSNYFGLSFLVLILWLFLKYQMLNTNTVRVLLLSSLVVVVLMMPPVVTLKGLDLYNVNYFLFKLAPFFRVTSRMSVLLHLGLLLWVGHMLQNIKFKSWVLYPLCFIILLETHIPLRLGSLAVPEIYSYIGSNFVSSERVVVYPYSRTLESFLWLPVHKQLLVNPRGYTKEGFSSESFTIDLFDGSPTLKEKLLDLDVKYIINFDPETYSTMTIDDFSVVASFNDGVIYEINE